MSGGPYVFELCALFLICRAGMAYMEGCFVVLFSYPGHTQAHTIPVSHTHHPPWALTTHGITYRTPPMNTDRTQAETAPRMNTTSSTTAPPWTAPHQRPQPRQHQSTSIPYTTATRTGEIEKGGSSKPLRIGPLRGLSAMTRRRMRGRVLRGRGSAAYGYWVCLDLGLGGQGDGLGSGTVGNGMGREGKMYTAWIPRL
jgi:hypothetical protein